MRLLKPTRRKILIGLITAPAIIGVAKAQFNQGQAIGSGGFGNINPVSVPPPLTSLVSIDFVNGVYLSAGSSVAVTSLFGSNVDVGTSFDPADIVPGSGLKGMPSGGTSVPSFIGDLLTALIGTVGCSVVFDMDIGTDTNLQLIGTDTYHDPDFSIDIFWVLAVGSMGDGTFSFNYNLASPQHLFDNVPVNVLLSARNKLALTISKPEVSYSLNGSTTATEIPSPQADWTQVNESYQLSAGYAFLRSITVYAPQDAASLAMLSALS